VHTRTSEPGARHTRAARPGLPTGTLLFALRTAAAAVLAFVAAVVLTGAERPLFAPWTALFALYPTVAGSFRGGTKRLTALLLGGAVAVGTVEAVGPGPSAIGVVVLVAALVGRWSLLGDQGLQVPAGAILVLLAAGEDPSEYALQLLAETAVGVGAGLLVTLAVPPLQFRSAGYALDRLRDRIARLLDDVADEACGGGGVLDWRDWGRRLDAAGAEARATVWRSQDAVRLNVRARRLPAVPQATRCALDALEHAAVEARGVGRSLVWDTAEDPQSLFLEDASAERLSRTLRETAAAVRLFGDGDRTHRDRYHRHLREARRRLEALAEEVRHRTRTSGVTWSRENAVVVAVERLLAELESSRGALVPAS
jgi:hypothetical protein